MCKGNCEKGACWELKGGFFMQAEATHHLHSFIHSTNSLGASVLSKVGLELHTRYSAVVLPLIKIAQTYITAHRSCTRQLSNTYRHSS